MIYSYKGARPNKLPFRIDVEEKLDDGSSLKVTRTDPSTFTEEELQRAGFVRVDDAPPEHDSRTHKAEWNGSRYSVVSLSEEDMKERRDALWKEIRESRDRMILEVEWRISRYQSQMRLGIAPQDDLSALDKYIQALRDVTAQPDPFNIVWPVLGSAPDSDEEVHNGG